MEKELNMTFTHLIVIIFGIIGTVVPVILIGICLYGILYANDEEQMKSDIHEEYIDTYIVNSSDFLPAIKNQMKLKIKEKIICLKCIDKKHNLHL